MNVHLQKVTAESKHIAAEQQKQTEELTKEVSVLKEALDKSKRATPVASSITEDAHKYQEVRCRAARRIPVYRCVIVDDRQLQARGRKLPI